MCTAALPTPNVRGPVGIGRGPVEGVRTGPEQACAALWGHMRGLPTGVREPVGLDVQGPRKYARACRIETEMRKARCARVRYPPLTCEAPWRLFPGPAQACTASWRPAPGSVQACAALWRLALGPVVVAPSSGETRRGIMRLAGAPGTGVRPCRRPAESPSERVPGPIEECTSLWIARRGPV